MGLLITGRIPGPIFCPVVEPTAFSPLMAPRILALKVSRAFRSPTRKQKIFLKGQRQKTSRLPLSDPAMEKQMEAQNADNPQATQAPTHR
jgi:hypothetical protein